MRRIVAFTSSASEGFKNPARDRIEGWEFARMRVTVSEKLSPGAFADFSRW